MWAVCGLGNPGRKYSRTRHNIGFMVLDSFLTRFSPLSEKEYTTHILSKIKYCNDDIVLLRPLTFMNLSGSAVKSVLKKFSITPDKLIVVYDDLDMEIGKLKIRVGGSSGGHRGVESILQQIGTKDFIRVKIGIGREPGMDSADYVLSKFRPEEQSVIRLAMDNAVDAIISIIDEGVEKTMNKFNKKGL